MSKVRKLAQGQQCTIRLPGCSHDPAQTVGAHYRLAGYSGAGQKPPDVPFMAFADDFCHSAVDKRIVVPGYSHTELRLAHAEACLRTVYWMIEQGHITVRGLK